MYLVKSLRTFFGTNAERIATALNLFLPGDEFIETDTSDKYVHNGMAWVTNSAIPDVDDLTTDTGASGEMVRVAAAGGLEYRTTAEVLSDIGAAASGHSHSAAGSDGQLLYNNGGAFGGSAVYWDDVNGRLGVGTATPAGTFHSLGTSGTNAIFQSNASTEIGINSFYNADTTDNNAALIRFDTDTTGAGAAARSQLVQFGAVFTVHNHATRTGNLVIRTYQAGAFTTRVTVGAGMVVGAPTGGDKGAGTINAVGIYDDNVLLSDFVFDDDYQLLSISAMNAFYQLHRHLPTIPGRKVWESEGKFSLGKLANHLWETVEVQAIYISQLDQRLKDLENGKTL